MNRDEILTLLKGVKEEAREKYNAEIKGIFGSYVRGEATEQSDIDVLVDFKEGADLFDLVGLGFFLEERLHCKVDVVSQRAMRKEIEPYIFRDMVYL